MKDTNFCISVTPSSFSEYFDYICDNQLNIELYLGHTANIKKNEKALLQKFQEGPECGKILTFHGPFYRCSATALGSFERFDTLEEIKWTIELARLLRPRHIVFHADYDSLAYRNIDEWLRVSLPFWSKLVNLAEEIDFRLAVENTIEENGYPIKQLLEAIPTDRLGTCIDIGHVNLLKDNRLEKWFRLYKDRTIQLHMHDNYGIMDNHMALGDGEIDFDATIKFVEKHASENTILTIENKSIEAIKRSVQWISNHFSDK